MSLRKLFSMGAVFLFLFSVSCTKKSSNQTQVLDKANGTELQDLDPHIVSGVPEHHVISELFEGLVTMDPKTAEPIPGQAESWTVSKDGKVYTFKLREGLKWTNGDPVVAGDFVYAFRRLVDPKTAAKYAYHGGYIKNGDAITKGKIKDLSALGVRAIDDRTLEVTLETPTPFFVPLTYHYSLYPVHQKTIEKFGNKWTLPENIVSNGPFKLRSWQLNKVLIADKNPTYWDAANVKLETVNFYPIENTDTEEKMFRAGKLHVGYEIPLPKIPHWLEKKDQIYHSPYLGVYYYHINTTKKALKDKRVRQALSLAIDREQITKNITRAGQMPATAFTPPGTGGFQPSVYLNPKVTPEDLAKAKKLLAEAGYPNGKGFPKFDILYNTQESHKKIAEAIQEMWKKNLGINVGLYNQEWKSYLANRQTLNYEVARAGWIGDYNDPLTFLEMYVTGGGNNDTGFSNKQYDDLVAKAKLEMDAKKRGEIFNQIEAILMDELPVVPIYIYTRTYLIRPEVAGWYPNIMDFHPLKFVSIK